MPAVYVASWDQPRSAERTVYMLVLPRRDAAAGTWSWDELAVRRSGLHGLGVFPQAGGGLDWARLSLPVLLPYLGAESVVEDLHLHKCLVAVLHGEFSRLSLAELRARHGGEWARNGLCAVRQPARGGGRRGGAEPALADDERLLQVSSADGGGSVCYLLEADVRSLLHLAPARARPPHGARAPAGAQGGGGGGGGAGGAAREHGHLFELLAAHELGQHADRHLGTHLATIKRKEGWVVVNAHPALGDGLGLVGLINEPEPRERPGLKLVHRSVELLADGCAELRRLGARQPPGAEAAWREAVLPHDTEAAAKSEAGGVTDGGFGWRHGERMVVYLAARRAYSTADELTVDYGRSYRREYASGDRKPHAAFAQLRAAAAAAHAPAAREAAALLAAAAGAEAAAASAPGCADGWPLRLRGWWNPDAQPSDRPTGALLAVDWVARGAVGPVVDQGACGSCWAFSAVEAISAGLFLGTGRLVALSAQQLLSCDRGGRSTNAGCTGWLPSNAFLWVREHGICAQAEYAYASRLGYSGGCESTCTPVARVGGFARVPPSDEVALLGAVSERPLSVAVEADGRSFLMYRRGVYDDSSCGAALDHALLLVGYGTTADGTPFCTVKNSWGRSWGEGGYMRLIRGHNL